MGDEEGTALHEVSGVSLKCQRSITKAELMEKQMEAAQKRKELKQKKIMEELEKSKDITEEKKSQQNKDS